MCWHKKFKKLYNDSLAGFGKASTVDASKIGFQAKTQEKGWIKI